MWRNSPRGLSDWEKWRAIRGYWKGYPAELQSLHFTQIWRVIVTGLGYCAGRWRRKRCFSLERASFSGAWRFPFGLRAPSLTSECRKVSEKFFLSSPLSSFFLSAIHRLLALKGVRKVHFLFSWFIAPSTQQLFLGHSRYMPICRHLSRINSCPSPARFFGSVALRPPIVIQLLFFRRQLI